MALYLYIPVAWLVAQLSKLCVESIRTGHVSMRHFTRSGGMPSGHSAVVSSLVMAIALTEGTNNSPFVISLVLAVIVTYDAFGHHNIKRHTLFEVFLGVIVGVMTMLIAWLFVQ